MKKSVLTLILAATFSVLYANADTEPVVTIEIPASSIQSIDVNYEKQEPSATSKAVDATKSATKKTVNATKDFTNKTVTATKSATKKTVKATKEATNKTVKTTKELTDKTVDGTKDLIENLNPNKPVTLDELETTASINKLKAERDEVKAAYNSKIKDVNAQIRAAEKSTTITDVQRQNKIYTLNKEKISLTEQRDIEITKYNSKIKELKVKK